MRLLIATDVSPHSHIVQEEVSARPWPLGTEILVLRCVDSATYPALPSLAALALKHTREELQQFAKGLNEIAGLHVSTIVVDGHPAKTIVAVAEDWGADFIFMGSHGAGPVGRLLLGSTVTEVLHHAPCAMEIGKDRDANDSELAPGRPWPRGDGFHGFLRATGSIGGNKNLFCTAVLRRSIGPWTANVPQMETGYLDAHAWAEIRDEAMDEAKRAADAVLAQLKAAGLAADSVVPSGFEGPRASILDEAVRWQADLIIAGSHGRGGLDRFLLGSVSEALALRAPCSVEVFREKRVRLAKDVHGIEVGYIPVTRTADGGA